MKPPLSGRTFPGVLAVARRLARSPCYDGVAMLTFRLTCEALWVNVRVREMNGRWMASADTSDGPSLALGSGAVEAIEAALAPFDGAIEELLASLPGREAS